MDIMRIGPAGGSGGAPFDHYDIPEDARITAVHIHAGWLVYAIHIDYERIDGSASGGMSTIGGAGDEKDVEHHTFTLDEDEFLVGISGRSGWYVDSLRLHTNKRVSPKYGGDSGDRDYLFEAPAGYEVFGLFGRAGWYIDALGITARPQLELDDEHYDDDETWLTPVDEGESIPVRVVVRREVVNSPEELDELEDAALAEAIADLSGDEGTADAAVYTQILEDTDSRGTIAVVMAVAGEAGTVEVVGDERGEVAVMVTDSVESEEDLALLEEEAVEGAVELFMEESGGDRDEVSVTIFSGVTEDEDTGLVYGAAVALVSDPVESAPSRTRAVEVLAKHEARPKDLELVEGIGPKIAGLLIDHGIMDLADLAAAPVERLRAILDAAGKRFRLADPTTWPEQAALGASGAMEAMKELQARLKGGRK